MITLWAKGQSRGRGCVDSFVDLALDSRLREPRFESCAAVWNFGEVVFLSIYIVPFHLAVWMSTWLYTVVGICTRSLRTLISVWLDASQGSWDGVWLNRSVRELKCKALWVILRIGYCAIKTITFFKVAYCYDGNRHDKRLGSRQNQV